MKKQCWCLDCFERKLKVYARRYLPPRGHRKRRVTNRRVARCMAIAAKRALLKLETQLANAMTARDQAWENRNMLRRELTTSRAEVLRLNELGKKERAEGESMFKEWRETAEFKQRELEKNDELIEKLQGELQAERAKVARVVKLLKTADLGHVHEAIALLESLQPAAPKPVSPFDQCARGANDDEWGCTLKRGHAGPCEPRVGQSAEEPSAERARQDAYRRKAEAFESKGGKLCGGCTESRATELARANEPGHWAFGECVGGCAWYVEQSAAPKEEPCERCGHVHVGARTCDQPQPGADTSRPHYVCACREGAGDATGGTANVRAVAAAKPDPRPHCIRCGKPWVPDEGCDATVCPCPDCSPTPAKEFTTVSVPAVPRLAEYIFSWLRTRNGAELDEAIGNMSVSSLEGAKGELEMILQHGGRPPNWVPDERKAKR